MRVAAIRLKKTPEEIGAFAEACLRFSPTLCVKRKGFVFIEIGSCHRLYTEENFLARMQVLLRRFELEATVKIADSLLESLILIEYGTLDFHRLPITSFIDFVEPFRVDVEVMEKTLKLIESLKKVGVQAVSQFLKIPLGELSARFGSVAVFLSSRIQKEIGVPWPLWIPAEKIIELREFEEREQFSTIESLLYFIKPILDRIFNRMYGRGFCVSSIRLQLNLEKFSFTKEPIREWRLEFMFPQTTSRGALPIFRERLSRDLDRKPLESVVQSLEFEVLQRVRNSKSQSGFFSSENTEEKLNSTFAQLSEGLDKGRVFRATINENPLPERSWKKCSEEQKAAPDLNDYIPMRPTKLLRRPEPVHIAKDTIFIRSRPYKILHWSNVEQISTDWIQSEVVRSYYRLQIAGKPPVWIFKENNDDYFLHGYYG